MVRRARLAILACSHAARLLAVCSLAACSREPPEPSASTPAGSSSLIPWSRGASARPPEAAGDAGPELATSADPAALDEILAAVPKTRPGPTGEDGGTAIGTTTASASDSASARASASTSAPASASPSAPLPAAPRISVGKISLQAEVSSPSIERAARAQLYWNLVQRCRDKDGAILPPDAITLTFHIDEDGYIVPATITATAADARHADPAHCMRRELSAATFRAPAGARGLPASVSMTVPSVD